ncbi:MPN domain-containing protein [Favolaschia claudopus]|uniref:MPN domain-containing protein n=1 Tax=Favolaschia claudopus TaxID=2862362 RepID=A0AAW0D303_9AGAR
MSSHQRSQGYAPGAWGSALGPAVPEFDVNNNNSGNPVSPSRSTGTGIAALDAARAAANAPMTGAVGYSTPFGAPPDAHAALRRERSERTDREREKFDRERERERSERDEREREDERRRNGGKPRLRTVLLPHATLPRFLAIASVNTARNLETCGLLLGREVVKGLCLRFFPSSLSCSLSLGRALVTDECVVGSTSGGENPRMRYVVETLLIPKQHATSDTCTMDEEEGVLEFTERRGLITLGWIHTHPSQSCFMSSVDLHTHASFQCMLPESFAVVCAPKSEPSFGIFRLTDPPGLEIVLKCTAKQAFHPHPDRPIYTDADKGHVQMREAALEIVDLR